MAELDDCDALAVLIVRLAGDQPPKGELRWHRWDEAPGATREGLPEEIGRRSGWEEPFKHLPGDGEQGYFNAHVERLLFPAEGGRGARWICCPDELYVEVGRGGDEAPRRARIDLLERLATPIDSGSSFGLIHLSLLAPDDPSAPDTLWWRWAVASPYRQSKDVSELSLRRGRKRKTLNGGRRPARALAQALFGDPHEQLERSSYTVLLAKRPANVDEEAWGREQDEEWRRDLALPVESHEADELAAERENRQTVWLAKTPCLLLGRSAVFATGDVLNKSQARSLRSYWSESVVVGLLQQDALEAFQDRLADVPDLLDADIQQLRRDWLGFRNVLWWSQLSPSSEIPQQLLARLRNALGTSQLFAELEEDLALYSEHQHQVLEEKQANALANLQVYGAAIVVLGTLLTGIGLFGGPDCVRAAFVAGAVLVSVAVLRLVPWLLRRQGNRAVTGPAA